MKKLVWLLLIVSCTGNVNRKHVYKNDLMYTVFDIVVYSSYPKYELSKKIDKVWEHLSYLESELSPAGDGLVGRLNKTGFVSEDENPEIFATVSNFISLSKNVSRDSEGAFDLTVYPLVRLWGFYIQDQHRVPTAEEISNTLLLVGMDKIAFTNNGIQLQKDVKIDLGAIAKGYAVDVAASMLIKDPEIHAGIVNAGGNLRVFGRKPDNSDWHVGIRNPAGGNIEEVITLYDGEAIATSGDYEQFFEYEGVTYHHIFDPTTGRPATHGLASTSVVVSNSAELSDVLSTTLLSMGQQKGEILVNKLVPNASMFFIYREGDELKSEGNAEWNKRK